MCIVLDYIQKYPLRTKQILGISYEQYQSFLVSAIARHKELENLMSIGRAVGATSPLGEGSRDVNESG
ncbi:MAG: hypothetical protein KME30_10090 [Iphinoe sp. HA4291-MV1]|jgi:hypothetical protein|nr:hypothetical protein [Iphinoe sp. HA4291-MV1]